MEKMVSSENHCQTKAFFLNKKIDTKTIRRILSLPFPKERTSPAGTRGTKWFGIISSEGSVDVHMITRESNIEKLSRGWIASLKHPWSPLITSGKNNFTGRRKTVGSAWRCQSNAQVDSLQVSRTTSLNSASRSDVFNSPEHSSLPSRLDLRCIYRFWAWILSLL